MTPTLHDRRTEQRDALLDRAAMRLARVGFRRTQMLHVAQDLGLAKGTVYLYVESKEALLDLVLRHEIDGFTPSLDALPYATRPHDEVNAFLRDAVRRHVRLRSMPDRPSRDPARASRELRAIIGELYDIVSANWRAIKIIERSAVDWPGLYEIFYVEGRRGLMTPLVDYLQAGIGGGALLPVPDIPTAARYVIESVSWFGMNRRLTPESHDITEANARATCVELAARAFTGPMEPAMGRLTDPTGGPA